MSCHSINQKRNQGILGCIKKVHVSLFCNQLVSCRILSFPVYPQSVFLFTVVWSSSYKLPCSSKMHISLWDSNVMKTLRINDVILFSFLFQSGICDWFFFLSLESSTQFRTLRAKIMFRWAFCLHLPNIRCFKQILGTWGVQWIGSKSSQLI